jgi:hypothetical protein
MRPAYEVSIECCRTTQKSRPVMLLSERLNHESRFFSLVHQLDPHLLPVAFYRRTGSSVWRRRIQSVIYKGFPGFVPKSPLRHPWHSISIRNAIKHKGRIVVAQNRACTLTVPPPVSPWPMPQTQPPSGVPDASCRE